MMVLRARRVKVYIFNSSNRVLSLVIILQIVFEFHD